MKLPEPPPLLPSVNIVSLKAGTVLHHFHSTSHPPNSFNPCRGKPSRFAPLRDLTGGCVSTLYAGQTLECAAFESVFRYVSIPKNRPGAVRLSVLNNMAHAELTLQRSLKLAGLFGPDQRALRVRDSAITRARPRHYSSTVKWAAAYHDQFRDLDGLAWTSYQGDPDCAYLLFGDRVRTTDLSPSTSREALSDASLLNELHLLGLRARIVLIT